MVFCYSTIYCQYGILLQYNILLVWYFVTVQYRALYCQYGILLLYNIQQFTVNIVFCYSTIYNTFLLVWYFVSLNSRALQCQYSTLLPYTTAWLVPCSVLSALHCYNYIFCARPSPKYNSSVSVRSGGRILGTRAHSQYGPAGRISRISPLNTSSHNDTAQRLTPPTPTPAPSFIYVICFCLIPCPCLLLCLIPCPCPFPCP